MRARARVSGKTGPRTWTHPPGVLQRGTTTGKHNGETKREQTGNMKNGKMKKNEKKKRKKVTSIYFKFI